MEKTIFPTRSFHGRLNIVVPARIGGRPDQTDERPMANALIMGSEVLAGGAAVMLNGENDMKILRQEKRHQELRTGAEVWTCIPTLSTGR